MSSDATYLPIGFPSKERSEDAVSSDSASQVPPSLKTNTGSKRPTTELANAPQLRDDASDSVGATDELLLEQTAKGSKEALGLLFRRYRRSVLSVASRILRNGTEAEDLCQEVFILLFQKAKLFNPGKSSASSWIIQVAYHRAMNRRKYLAHRRHYDALEFDEQQIADSLRPMIDQITARNLLSRLGEQLSDEQRNTFELHFFEGYSLREIAEKTNQKIGNVRHHFYRGLERLRSNLLPIKTRK